MWNIIIIYNPNGSAIAAAIYTFYNGGIDCMFYIGSRLVGFQKLNSYYICG